MRISILLLGFFSLFAQVFNGAFALSYWTITLCTILFGVTAYFKTESEFDIRCKLFLLIIFFLGILLGHALEIYDYYTSYQVAGNDYGGWILLIPTIVFPLIILIKTVSHYDKKSL